MREREWGWERVNRERESGVERSRVKMERRRALVR